MKRKNMLTALALVMIMLLSVGCSSKDSSYYYGDEVTKNTMVVCIDSYATDTSTHIDSKYEISQFFQELAAEVKSACGIESIAFTTLPQDGAERETALQRMRTEIMAGGGPDVFVMQTTSSPTDDADKSALFNFPEKDMETGLFLPLDEYMENSTRFTDWDAQTQVILNAGRNDEGQLIIPTTYTFPILVYPADEANIPYTTELTAQDIIEDPSTEAIGAALYSDKLRDRTAYDAGALIYMLGQFADHRTEELLFTEEELYNALSTMRAIRDKVDNSQVEYSETYARYFNLIYEMSLNTYDSEMALIPTYSMNGCVTASIRSYAAINRNTAFPDEAYSFIDYIMSEKVQCSSGLYHTYFNNGLPLQNDLGSAEKPLNSSSAPVRYLDTPHFDELLEIKEQITAVNFESKIDTVLLHMIFDSHLSGDDFSREDVASTYEKLERMIGE